jgi:hypothetical protein
LEEISCRRLCLIFCFSSGRGEAASTMVDYRPGQYNRPFGREPLGRSRPLRHLSGCSRTSRSGHRELVYSIFGRLRRSSGNSAGARYSWPTAAERRGDSGGRRPAAHAVSARTSTQTRPRGGNASAVARQLRAERSPPLGPGHRCASASAGSAIELFIGRRPARPHPETG